MGADAEIFVFDYDRYRRTAVPGLVEVIGGAGVTPWLDGVCRRLGEHFAEEWLELADASRAAPGRRGAGTGCSSAMTSAPGRAAVRTDSGHARDHHGTRLVAYGRALVDRTKWGLS
ncbi:hypothetical protein Apa02nite_060710 [Actinoplanes palleronii]|uniref:Uncharacterized protein n=1 Tax=Actinoplanes palleronii TaxID=113570 RepID=A0ABQ4BH22_9ACTN|nr:hypothetical protein Apa02nite_060710 [Actinoplanes palleronii]